jgi:hypothetical protein
VAALQGVSVSFAPLFLYWSGKGMFHGSEWLVVPSCFAVILLVGFFYMLLGSAVNWRIEEEEALGVIPGRYPFLIHDCSFARSPQPNQQADKGRIWNRVTLSFEGARR